MSVGWGHTMVLLSNAIGLRMEVRQLLPAIVLLACLTARAQSVSTSIAAEPAKPTPASSPSSGPSSGSGPGGDRANTPLLIPAGTKVALALSNAISTKGTREGDAVYAHTTFPVALNNRIVVPAGTYVQGRITHIQRGGHASGRAEVSMHFSSLIYASGYTVLLPGALESAPDVDKASVKDKEGTIQQDSQTGQEAATIAGSAGSGAVIGGLSQGAKGGLIGAGAGGAVGTAIAMLSRGKDVILPAGTTFEMVIQREVELDASRLQN